MPGHFFLFNAVQEHQSVSLSSTMLHVPPLQNRAALHPQYKMPEYRYPAEVTPFMPDMDIYYPGLLWQTRHEHFIPCTLNFHEWLWFQPIFKHDQKILNPGVV